MGIATSRKALREFSLRCRVNKHSMYVAFASILQQQIYSSPRTSSSIPTISTDGILGENKNLPYKFQTLSRYDLPRRWSSTFISIHVAHFSSAKRTSFSFFLHVDKVFLTGLMRFHADKSGDSLQDMPIN